MQNPDFWARTHQGLSRDKNEDAFLWLGDAGTNDQGFLWCVCDGMGGEAAGELASSVVVQRVSEIYPHALKRSKSPHIALEEAFQAANRRLLYMQEVNPDLSKMGSTVAAAAYYEEQLWLASVGDSRIYTWSRGRLTQRSVDHTKYEKMMELGVLKPADARPDHPAHHVLLNVLGRSEMFVDTLEGRRLPPTDTCVLLCSDGLSSFVDEPTIHAALTHLDSRDATRLLLSAALPNSNDNITLTVVRFSEPVTPLPIEEVAATLSVSLIKEDGEPLQTSSSNFNAATRWETHRTGGRPTVSVDEDASESEKRQTVMFSPDAVQYAREAAMAPDAETQAAAPTPSAAASPARPSSPEEERVAASERAHAALAERRANKQEERREPLAPLPARSSTDLLPWFLGGTLLVFVVAGLLLWGLGSKRLTTFSTTPIESAEADADEGEGEEASRKPQGFQHPESPRLPDRVHPADAMPGYLVGNGQLWMDAHEVTVGQFYKIGSSSFALQGVVEQVDASRFAGLPCATGMNSEAARANEPVCASPQAAAVYCETVGRHLPREADWRAVLAADKALIAAGHAKTFTSLKDGAPSPVSGPISGLFGVYDGLAEALEPNATQRRFKDLVLWVDGDVRVVRGADTAGDTSTMMGFRCVERVVVEEIRQNEQVAEESSQLGPSAERSTSGRSKPSTGAPVASDAISSDTATNDTATGGRASSGVAPRIDPPEEAPMDPNVSDESMIIQRLRQQGAGAP